ncbi:hypothetical protein BABINDRAFT_182972 [Babjeviella inositovora NRRL Y-12698]|uniref:F-box domain-containing protein n=1 Tax=Babjeviella inositovora NRRL Y-12698 TaxID=984486 RepID=A0A1E3QTJ8_9ASCO|nr:uncharacterized protein BABINDRAFT_182972 [Babjeviella inositovora NRRL Y-12698]ODQ80970.1 hypothetical protein BABINDRAFT_182972 [Babjeviella inositovora NRRL Y-12698]
MSHAVLIRHWLEIVAFHSNKQRPKKFRPLYKRYVYGSNSNKTYSSGDEDEAEAPKPFANNVPIVRSIYVLTDAFFTGRVWPKSKFEKVDVLRCAIHGRNTDYEMVEEEVYEEVTDESHLLKLPVELIQYILEILAATKLSPRFLRLNKMFYQICMPLIYERPDISSHNFFKFVEAITNNKKLGGNVKVLDMRQIQQSSKNSFVSRLLRRCSSSLQSFTAPQTSFGYAPLVSLRHCHDLKVLDLRLVSETVDLKELFDAIKSAKHLTHLSFPRSSVQCNDYENLWPPNLWYLRLSGGISDDFLYNSEFPGTIRKLEFSHCPYVTKSSIYHLLHKLGGKLTSLVIQYPMPGLGGSDMDMIFKYCPNLLSLEITVDYVSKDLFEDYCLPLLRYPRPLKNIYIESSGMIGQGDKLHPDDLTLALIDDKLPCLLNVKINVKLGWNPESDDMEDLVGVLEERGGGVYMLW